MRIEKDPVKRVDALLDVLESYEYRKEKDPDCRISLLKREVNDLKLFITIAKKVIEATNDTKQSGPV